MKYLLMSDTHGEALRALQAIQRHHDVCQCFHMGDVGFDCDLIKPCGIVCGNHDRNLFPQELILDLQGYRTLVTHGHRFEYELIRRMKQEKEVWESWDSCMEALYDTICDYAQKEHIDMVLFGHTHTAYFAKRKGIYLCNPGSLCFSHDGRPPSYALMTIEQKIQVTFHFLKGDEEAYL